MRDFKLDGSIADDDERRSAAPTHNELRCRSRTGMRGLKPTLAEAARS